MLRMFEWEERRGRLTPTTIAGQRSDILGREVKLFLKQLQENWVWSNGMHVCLDSLLNGRKAMRRLNNPKQGRKEAMREVK